MADKPAGTLYLDLSETRQGTRCPFGLLEHPRRVVVTGLEYHTGADFMITPDSITTALEQNILSKPKMLIQRVTQKSFLFQRKTGMDMLGSIPDLANILQRMLAASEYKPWLLVVGEFRRASNGNTLVTYAGSTQESKFKYNALLGAWAAWQDFGGAVMVFKEDQELEWFIDQRLSASKIAKIEAGKQLIKPAADLGISAFADQARVLCGFPHVGTVQADKILYYCGGNLAQALMYMSMPGGKVVEADGVGERTREDWRELLGLNEHDYMVVVKENQWQTEPLLEIT